jgi:pilus assembly protein CpaE
MIAVNIATWLAARAPGRVLIVDLDLQFGQVATHLNLKPQLTVAELARDDQSLREPELLRTYAIQHDSGLAVLAAPGTPEPGRLITAEQVNLLLSTARTAYDTIVIDAGSELDERSLAVVERAEATVIPIVPEIGALKALHSLLEYLTEVGSAAATATFVLNHLFAREMLSMKQIEAAIGTKVTAEIPYDAGLYLKAVNEGIPIVHGAPNSAPARALGKLAAAATGISEDTAPSHDDRRGRLGGLRRRG